MKIKKTLKHCALGLALTCDVISAETTVANTVSISRYLSVPIHPQQSQVYLLRQQIEVIFPQNVITIKQAIQFILRFSGYQLMDTKLTSPSVRHLLQQSLPEIDRHFGPMTLEQGLKTLSGSSFTLLVDQIHRKIGFKLKGSYLTLYPTHPHFYHHHRKTRKK